MEDLQKVERHKEADDTHAEILVKDGQCQERLRHRVLRVLNNRLRHGGTHTERLRLARRSQ
jgi:hypothetical protein